MTTPRSSDPSPPDSTPVPKASTKCSTLNRLINLENKARETAGILTPTETLELVDLAGHYFDKWLEVSEELQQALWDLDHPTLKYL